MNDLISRQAAIDKLKSIITDREYTSITDEAKERIAREFFADIPSSDSVEVVRCKDCIHNHTKSWNQGKRDNPSCHFTDLIRSNEFYCGFGERAEE